MWLDPLRTILNFGAPTSRTRVCIFCCFSPHPLSHNKGDSDGCNFIAAFDSLTGNLKWHSFLITSNYIRITDAILDGDRNLIISGSFAGVMSNSSIHLESTNNAFFVCKFNYANGGNKWCRKVATAATENQIVIGNLAYRANHLIVLVGLSNAGTAGFVRVCFVVHIYIFL